MVVHDGVEVMLEGLLELFFFHVFLAHFEALVGLPLVGFADFGEGFGGGFPVFGLGSFLELADHYLCNFVNRTIIIKYKSHILSDFSLVLFPGTFLYLHIQFYVVTLYALTLLSAFPSHTMAFAVVLLAVTLLTLAARTRISLGNNRYSRHLIIAAVRTRTFVRTSSPCLKALAVVLLALCFGAVALDDFL